MAELITVPEGLVFVVADNSTYGKSVRWYSSQQDFDFSNVNDLIVLQPGEYCIVGLDCYCLLDIAANSRVVIANCNGQVDHAFYKRPSHRYGEYTEKQMVRLQARLEKCGYKPNVSSESDTVFEGAFEELRERERHLMSLRRSDVVKQALATIPRAMQQVLHTLHVQQQATPDEIARAEVIHIARIAQNALDWQASLLEARGELDAVDVTIPSV